MLIKITKQCRTAFTIAIFLAYGPLSMADQQPIGAELVLDNFTDSSGTSTFGTQWVGFTDQVMGGLSDMALSYRLNEDDHLSLWLRGEVRLENNGGFIQARLPVERGGRRLDAKDYTGIRIITRAKPGAYYIHLRTRATWLPWQYYGARIPVTGGDEWQTHDIPFTAFKGESTRRQLDIRQIKSIALVAYGEAFSADIELRYISLYR